VSFFGWAMIFVALGLLALAAFSLLGLRLWRQARSLGADITRAMDRQSAGTGARE
jgi:predicted MFS family arabinose efflux permease